MKFFKGLFITCLATFSICLAACNSDKNPSVTSNTSLPTSNTSKPTSSTSQTSKKDFEGITFVNKTYTYDGLEHYIFANGVPEFAIATYTNNSRINVGEQTAKVQVSAEGYNTLVLTAKLIIKSKKFEGITFKDQEFAYDGYSHSIYVEGAPDFANVRYENNNQYKKGTYVVTATITAANYETLVLKATMTISNKLPDAIVDSRTLLYTGNDQRIVYSLPDKLPSYTDISFKVDGKTVTEDEFVVKTIGEHTASITLTNTQYNYSPSTVNAKVTVIQNNVGGVDVTKTPLIINESLKYHTLRSKILDGNFTIKEEYFDDYFYPDGSTKSTLSHTTITYVNGDEAFEYFYYPTYDDFMENQTHYRHTKLSGGEVRSSYFEDGILNGGYWESSYKFDGEYYLENVIGHTGLASIAWLKEASDGGFENSEEGGYHTSYGSFKIDSINNVFIEDVAIHYYHQEFDHDEHTRYSIYNIGNTSINVPDVYDAFKVETEFEQKDELFINGLQYSFYDDHVSLDSVMRAISVAYLPKGSYIVPAIVNGLPVTKISTGYYSPYYNNDCTGYTFKFYFDRHGDYQGEYAYLGYVSGYTDIYELYYDGADILFYEEWQ